MCVPEFTAVNIYSLIFELLLGRLQSFAASALRALDTFLMFVAELPVEPA